MGEHNHPEVSMHTFPLADYMKCIYSGDWDGVGELMSASAAKLAEIGAEFAICPDNTIHQAYHRAVQGSSLPWVHIAEAVAERAQKADYGKLGITGTAYLMTGPVYPAALSPVGIEYEIPDDGERSEINRIIFNELVKGVFREASRDYLNGVFDQLKNRGCDAVVMGCTEIPILMEGAETPLPVLDSTRILARAALDYAIE